MQLWDACSAMGSPLCGERLFPIRENSCGKRFAIGCRIECYSLGGRITEQGGVRFRGMEIGLCGPDSWAVRLPPPFLVSGMWREFRVDNAIFRGILWDRG